MNRKIIVVAFLALGGGVASLPADENAPPKEQPAGARIRFSVPMS